MSKIQDFLHNRADQKYKNKLQTKVQEIRRSISTFEKLTNDELKSKMYSFIGTKEDNISDVFAIITIAISRIKNIDLYDVQLQGGYSLFEGNISEMKTGEGKTITSSLPAIARAICFKEPIHIVTVNEYLAKRDKEELEPIYNFFGLSVSLNLQTDSHLAKLEHYKADIMYSTASTLGFDYLNDNMVYDYLAKYNKRERAFALIDEVDLVLIDEARTPLIIGKNYTNPIEEIRYAHHLVSQLTPEDYKVDFKHKTVSLTEQGEKSIAKLYNIDSISSEENINKAFLSHQALLANYAYKEDIDYALEMDKGQKSVVIIDNFTGRLQFGRRYSNGLHQALEAKHSKNGIEILEENQTVATITLQNFFRLYNKLSGMSGTAYEDREEFMEVYGLNVVKIDTNKPVIREDKPAIIFDTMEDKWNHVVEKIKEYHSEQKPILIGTVSLDDSEYLSSKLNAANIQHQVLNARQDAKEAEIISQAGKLGAITIATNMAGRGTDIKVDERTQLVVISTELNESTRIDNQLKGRTSRQGAPGTTETILSAEDRIFERTALTEKIKNIAKFTGRDNAALHKVIRSVQEELEAAAFGGRKYSLKYDDIIREQRKIFYQTRDTLLTEHDLMKMNKYITKLSDKSVPHKILTLVDGNKDMALTFSRKLALQAIDEAWIKHVDKLERLKSAIGWRAQNGKNPIIIFQDEAQNLYNYFKNDIQKNINDILEPLKYHSDLDNKNIYYGSPDAANKGAAFDKTQNLKRRVG